MKIDLDKERPVLIPSFLASITIASIVFIGPLTTLTGCTGVEIGGKVGLYPVTKHEEKTEGGASFISPETWAWIDGTWKSVKQAVTGEVEGS